MEPSRARLLAPGVLLGVLLGGAAFLVCRALPPSFLRSDILTALIAGAVVANTPLGRAIGLRRRATDAAGDTADRYDPGLRFIGHAVLRGTIVLLGLRVQASFFATDELPLIAGVAIATIPSAFLVAHAAGAALGLRRPLVDLVAGGTMICGATAANAIAPVVDARREEQAIAVSALFVFSVVALVTFHPVASLVGLDPSHAGLWAGLAVNDLSSAIAVGQQMGAAGAVLAASSKSTRILLLTPTLLFFRLLRGRPAGEREGRGFARRLLDLLPLYLLGYIAFAVLRTIGDSVFRARPWWHDLLRVNDEVVSAGIVVVAASIGLHLDVVRLARVGARALLVSASASLWTAGLALAIILAAARGHDAAAILIGTAGLGAAALLFRRFTPPSTEKEGSWRRAPRIVKVMVLGLVFAVPLGLGGMKAASLLRRRARADRPAPAAVLSPRAAALRAAISDARCPAGMLFIPGGAFRMGANDRFNDDELPIHEVTVRDFCLDATEVTTAEYLRCASERRCTPLDNTVAWPDLADRDAAAWDELCNGNRDGYQDHPVNCVDWVQANAYCRVHGARLPTEDEWEYAARGGAEQRRYAWGDEFPDATRANLCGIECAELVKTRIRDWGPLYEARDGFPGTAPIGSFPAGNGRWGLMDMTGNVTEWLDSHYCPYPGKSCETAEHGARGNGFLANLPLKVRVARRNHDVPWHRSPDAGFRCAKPLP